MNDPILAGISRSTVGMVIVFAAAMLSISEASGQESKRSGGDAAGLESFHWDFGHGTDPNFDGWPEGWIRTTGTGYPRYVKIEISAHNPGFEQQIRTLDTGVVRVWQELRDAYGVLPSLPPPVLDAMVDRYLRIELDGGQAKVQSPSIAASRVFQYRFSCRIMTEGLRHDSARAELIFLNNENEEISIHSSPPMRGTTDWTQVKVDFVRPPVGAAKMIVRLIVERSENGLEDIRGTIGFDDIRIDQYPHLRISTDEALGVYAYGQPIVTTARIMGLPTGTSEIQFRIFDYRDREVAAKRIIARHESAAASEPEGKTLATPDSEKITWTAPPLDPGFYRMTASLPGKSTSTLSTETTLAVIDPRFGGPPHGSFGWSLPNRSEGILPKDLASWLTDLGVGWVKYPAWLATDDAAGAEELASIFAKLQEAGIQTVGVLDNPPEEEQRLYGVQGRRDLVASQLFRDAATWKPLLSPVMNRLSLKVRTWQLGADRDHSFLGRPNLREAVRQISTGLQGYGQPLRVAISWPWLVNEIRDEESSWQAVCRSTDPPLSSQELDSFLSLTAQDSARNRPRTWLMLDPIPVGKYDRDSRIRDLVMRMATVRSHRVQAAFVSDPRDPQQGLLTPSGRPDELLLPWRTTSRLIGNLNKTGSLQLRSKAKNIAFANSNRAVLMLWSAEPTEELIYLGEDLSSVDVWGKATKLHVEPNGNQPVQRIKIGPLPTFIIGVDPTLLAFRMSVAVKEKQLDSFLGQIQELSVSFMNPVSASLVGETRILPPKAWTVESPRQSWEALADREATQTFDIVLTNTAKIGTHELPIQFEIETDPPKLFTVYRNIKVGPEGLDLTVTTKLLPSGDLEVKFKFTNRGTRAQSYDCILFPPPGRQYQRQVVAIQPSETISRVFRWPNGVDLLGKRMLLRAVELDGRRVLNYSIDVSR